MNRILSAGMALCMLLCSSLMAAELGTKFLYQGTLHDGVNPANGQYDFQIQLYDDPAAGTMLGENLLEDVQVTDGLFQVELDFGNDIQGLALWLQVNVRPGADVGVHTELSPRQPLLPAPYALSLRPGARVSREANVPNLSVQNGFPAMAVLVTKTAIDAFTNDGIGVRALANSGVALYGKNFATDTTLPAVRGVTDSTQDNAAAVQGEVTSISPGSLASAVRGINNGTGTTGVGVYGSHAGNGWGVYGLTKTGNGVIGLAEDASGNGIGVFGQTYSMDGYGGYFINSDVDDASAGLYARGGNNAAPDIILGANSPASDDGRIISDPSASGSDIFLESNDAVVVQLDRDNSGDDADFEIWDKDENILFNVDESGYMVSRHPNGTALFTVNANGNLVTRHPNGMTTMQLLASELGDDGSQIRLYKADGSVGITLDAEFNAGGPGRVTTQELQITGGSDLSEQFDVRGADPALQPEPGMVVCIDADNPGQLVVSTRPYDRTVAGVISGAGGVRTGMMMGQEGSVANGEHAVALTGRVYVNVDASHGAVQPGDLLTTSPTPGHAMKVADHAQAQGAILGKAMTRLDEGTGLVLVLVTLQ